MFPLGFENPKKITVVRDRPTPGGRAVYQPCRPVSFFPSRGKERSHGTGLFPFSGFPVEAVHTPLGILRHALSLAGFSEGKFLLSIDIG
jgi:hypothetical protein